MRFFKILLLTLVILFILVQFVPKPAKNIATQVSENDISKVVSVSPGESALLKSSCYDCHSDNTVYPWYSKIQPFAWWLGDHIEDGKKHLNFSQFGKYTAEKQAHKLEEVVEMIQKKEMPLKSYTIIHTDAKLNDEERKILVDWATRSMNAIPQTQ